MVVLRVKVECDNEFRRFSLGEVYDLDQLVNMLRVLFPPARDDIEMSLFYYDNECDLVRIISDAELQEAAALMCTDEIPLRLLMTQGTTDVVSLPKRNPLPRQPVSVASSEVHLGATSQATGDSTQLPPVARHNQVEISREGVAEVQRSDVEPATDTKGQEGASARLRDESGPDGNGEHIEDVPPVASGPMTPKPRSADRARTRQDELSQDELSPLSDSKQKLFQSATPTPPRRITPVKSKQAAKQSSDPESGSPTKAHPKTLSLPKDSKPASRGGAQNTAAAPATAETPANPGEASSPAATGPAFSVGTERLLPKSHTFNEKTEPPARLLAPRSKPATPVRVSTVGLQTSSHTSKPNNSGSTPHEPCVAAGSDASVSPVLGTEEKNLDTPVVGDLVVRPETCPTSPNNSEPDDLQTIYCIVKPEPGADATTDSGAAPLAVAAALSMTVNLEEDTTLAAKPATPVVNCPISDPGTKPRSPSKLESQKTIEPHASSTGTDSRPASQVSGDEAPTLNQPLAEAHLTETGTLGIVNIVADPLTAAITSVPSAPESKPMSPKRLVGSKTGQADTAHTVAEPEPAEADTTLCCSAPPKTIVPTAVNLNQLAAEKKPATPSTDNRVYSLEKDPISQSSLMESKPNASHASLVAAEQQPAAPDADRQSPRTSPKSPIVFGTMPSTSDEGTTTVPTGTMTTAAALPEEESAKTSDGTQSTACVSDKDTTATLSGASTPDSETAAPTVVVSEAMSSATAKKSILEMVISLPQLHLFRSAEMFFRIVGVPFVPVILLSGRSSPTHLFEAWRKLLAAIKDSGTADEDEPDMRRIYKLIPALFDILSKLGGTMNDANKPTAEMVADLNRSLTRVLSGHLHGHTQKAFIVLAAEAIKWKPYREVACWIHHNIGLSSGDKIGHREDNDSEPKWEGEKMSEIRQLMVGILLSQANRQEDVKKR